MTDRSAAANGSVLRSALSRFLALEAAGGIVLFAAAVLAMIFENSALGRFYDLLLSTPAIVQIGELGVNKPLLLWINDGLMAIFFCLVGLEIKREFVDGELRTPAQVLLPLAAAAGGMIVPAAIFAAFNWSDPASLRGWAIPAATDIAFALGVLSLLGSRVPNSLKVFLLAVAVFDDLGAILIIAFFYTEKLSALSLGAAGAAFVVLAAMNLFGVRRIAAYVFVGTALWLAVLKSGVHATIAGVLLGLILPIAERDGFSPSRALEDMLHPWVAFAILPIFAFANAGVPLQGFGVAGFADPIAFGVSLGLLVGKPVGIVVACWLMLRTGLADMPSGGNWPAVVGVGILAGIGFTMSLFIATLAFDDGAAVVSARIGILSGSIFAAIVGFLVLRWALAAPSKTGMR